MSLWSLQWLKGGVGAGGGAGGRDRVAKEATPAPPPFHGGNHTLSIEKLVNGIPWNRHCQIID